MKDIVINMDDFTDSREVMAARPHPFTLWLVYIILGIVTAFIVWASISQMDEYVKVRGTVRPVEDTASIKFPISGTIQSISVKDGQTVKKGDVLFEIDAAASKNQKATEEKQLNNIQTQINNTELLCNSIKMGKNQFNSSNESQKDYQSRYNDYLASVKSTKIQYESNSLDLAQTKQDAQQTISSANQSIEKNQKSLQDYKTLSASISSNLNKFTEDNSICSKNTQVIMQNIKLTSKPFLTIRRNLIMQIN